MTAIELLEKADKILTFRTKKLRRDELISMIGKSRRLIMDTLALPAKPCEWTYHKKTGLYSFSCQPKRYQRLPVYDYCPFCGQPIEETKE